MKYNENILIERIEEKKDFGFTCPFCGKVNLVMNEDLCNHVLFACETANYTPLYYREDIYNLIRKTLKKKKMDFLEDLGDSWECYKPVETRSEDPEIWDEAKSDLISEYMDACDGGFGLEDFMKVMEVSKYKDKDITLEIAQTDDVEANTYYILGDL